MLNNPSEEVLETIAGTLIKEREEVRNKRSASNLPKIWQTAREQFQGLDSLNKEAGPEGLVSMESGVRLTGFRPPDEDERSTVFDNITRSYTEAGTSKVSDILLPTGKMPWDLIPSSVSQAETVQGILAKYPEAQQTMMSFPDLMEELSRGPEETAMRILEAKRHIKDYLEECSWLGEIREQILEAGKVGAGVIKGPVPRFAPPSDGLRAFIEALPEHIQAELIPQLYYRPYSEVVRVENCFPDPNCGGNVQNGGFFWELIPDISRRRLEEMKDDPAYFAEQIDLCLEEGPQQPNGKKKSGGKPFELWLRTGEVEVEGERTFGVAVLCNKRLIKLTEYWLDKPSFPYDVLKWEPREDSWDGIGIPERIETPQRGLNTALRALHDNLGWSVGPQIIETQDLIEPKDGKWKPKPYKHWVAKKPMFNQEMDPKKALVFLEFPNYSADILPVVNYWLTRAEQVANLPLLFQGQKSSDSVGVTQHLENNATTNLRQIVKACDDEVFVPHIQRYYQWVQQYGPENAKADAAVVALGSSTLIVRELQQQILLQLLDRSLQPDFKLSPQRIMQAILEGNQFDVEQLRLSPEEEQVLQEAMSQPDPAVQAAQIRAEVDKYATDQRTAVEMAKLGQSDVNKQREVENSRDIVETQVAGNIATEAMREEKKAAANGGIVREASFPQSTSPPADVVQPPRPAPLPELSPEEALSSLGFE